MCKYNLLWRNFFILFFLTIFIFKIVPEGVSTMVYIVVNLCLRIAGPLKRWT